MFIGGGMDTDRRVSLLSHGDQLEKETWTKLEPWLSKYEIVWRMHVVPLRPPGSIYLRLGIDPNLETFTMNNYTAYVNMTRALGKIESNADDLEFPEEIWANLQRAVEVASKAARPGPNFTAIAPERTPRSTPNSSIAWRQALRFTGIVCTILSWQL
jgi:hypothetical protein